MEIANLWHSVGGTLSTISKLQRLLNAVIKVIYGGNKYYHVTSLIPDKLRWLRIQEKII